MRAMTTTLALRYGDFNFGKHCYKANPQIRRKMLPSSYLAHLDEVSADFQQKPMKRWWGGGVADVLTGRK